jgi:hypothetical protein
MLHFEMSIVKAEELHSALFLTNLLHCLITYYLNVIFLKKFINPAEPQMGANRLFRQQFTLEGDLTSK